MSTAENADRPTKTRKRLHKLAPTPLEISPRLQNPWDFPPTKIDGMIRDALRLAEPHAQKLHDRQIPDTTRTTASSQRCD